VKPDDLDDLDPVEPDAVLLDRVRARGAALRRRRRVQRFGSVVVAVAVVAVAIAVGIALTVGGTNHPDVSGPVSTSTSPTTSTAPPTGITAHLVLPVSTILAGSSMSGRVVVDNNTGHARHVIGCGGIFAVTLANSRGGQGSMGWTTCAMNITIPVGSSTYPVTIEGTYLECGGTPSPTMHACIDSREPPLPPGVYQATLAQSTTVVPTPPTIPIRVVARDDTSLTGLRAAALAWSRAFLTGTSADIFAMEGAECAPTTSTTLSGSTISAYLAGERAVMKQHLGMPLDAITAHGVSVRDFTGATGEALVQYDLPESKTGNDNWVSYAVEDGAWKVADCHAPIGGSSTSASSGAAPP
jgi:hypothetical protein